jgi:hypothetical protein
VSKKQNSENCEQCGTSTKGESSEAGDTTCSSCDLGKYQTTPGVCTACVPGLYASDKGLKTCTKCPVDTYCSESGKASQAECTPCSDIRGTNGVTAATTSNACLCKSSTTYNADGTSDGFYGGYDGEECQLCEKGATCPFDGAKLINLTAQAGYWRASLDSVDFSDCSKGYQGLNAVQLGKERCCALDSLTNISTCQLQNSSSHHVNIRTWSSDGQCLDTYRGVLCLECVKGYVRVGDDCKICKEGASLGMAYVAGALLMIPVFCGVVMSLTCENKIERAAQSGHKVMGQIKICITFVQILSSMKTTYNGIPWPLAFLTFVIPLTAINLDVVGLFGASVCSMAVPFAEKFLGE